jgi:hypothetical protein
MAEAFLRTFLLALPVCTATFAAPTENSVISLAGSWRFSLDPKGAGVTEQWFARPLAGSATLPGTTATNRAGAAEDARADRLSQRWRYVGKAWFQREIEIPSEWKNRRVILLLERTKASRVWVDNVEAGSQQIRLFTPHMHDLTGRVPPGKHRLTILVDNAYPFPVSGHALSDDTQTNWNGILGRIELIATDPVWIDRVKVTPDPARNSVSVEAHIGNITGLTVAGRLTIRTAHAPPKQLPFQASATRTVVGGELSLDAPAPKWDEFTPALQALSLALDAGSFLDRREVEFGLARFQRIGSRLVINGRPVFLRGNTDNCIFPLTGYPPMDVESWLEYFRLMKSYGLNHVRFHSWTPPEAAFTAADREGFYLLVELPEWARIPDPNNAGRAPFMLDEGRAILDAYGNHPSFSMLSLGNELSGDRQALASIVSELRRYDARPLYASGTNAFFSDPREQAGDDFWVTMRTRRGESGRTRASYSYADLPLGHIDTGPPDTQNDYRAALEHVRAPVIGHEVGQFESLPDFSEISKYKGVLAPRNLEILREKVKAAGLLNQWPDFVRASGELAVRCYREDIEAALRTPGFAGFELLDLQDYPGQGTALVGVLDAFLDSKGFITAERWREFCSPVVPLLRYAKYTWTESEAFSGAVELSQFGPKDLDAAVMEWSVVDASGHVVRHGSLPPQRAPAGGLSKLGVLSFALNGLAAPGRYEIRLSVEGASYRNTYPIWVYPDRVDTRPPSDVIVASEWNSSLKHKLKQGARVLLLPRLDRLPAAKPVGFGTDFWCFPMFEKVTRRLNRQSSPGTMGLLIDARHPALARFPTDSSTDWQWWQLLKHGRAAILDGAPSNFRAVVTVMDNVFRNQRMALLFETRYGAGSLLVCLIDLPAVQDQPEGRQMLSSLLAYAASNAFHPDDALPATLLDEILAEKAR